MALETLRIDPRACLRSGVCASLVPSRVALRGGEVVVSRPELSPADIDADAVADAVACCPGAALSVGRAVPEGAASPAFTPRRTR